MRSGRSNGRLEGNDDVREEVLQMAEDIDQAIAIEEEARAGEPQSTSYAVFRRVREIEAKVAAEMRDELEALSDDFVGSEETIETIGGAIAAQTKEIGRVGRARRAKEHLQQETHRRIRKYSVFRHPWVVRINTPTYGVMLLVAAGAVGILNASSFRVIRLSDPLALALAGFISVAYAFAIHLLPTGFGRRRKRDVFFWGAVVILGLITAGTIALTHIRGDYLTILDVTIDPWTFTTLQLFADGIAAYAALVYGHEDAAAMRQLQAEVTELKRQEKDLKADLERLEVKARKALQGQFTMVEGHLWELENIRTVRPEELVGLLIATLMKLRHLSPSLLERLEKRDPIPRPSEAERWEDWLAARAKDLNRPGAPPVPPLPPQLPPVERAGS